MLGLTSQIWVLFGGRLLSQVGTGLTLFYAPIVFVNQVGLSAGRVGLALGLGSVTGIAGRILGGLWSDRVGVGRKRTLMLSALLSALGTFGLAAAQDFNGLVIGNLVLGLGVGLYWPANEAAVADLTEGEVRRSAFALTRLGDSLGLGLGVALGGLLIESYRWLFILDGLSFLVFLGIIAGGFQEPKRTRVRPAGRGEWHDLLRDRLLLGFIPLNILFTSYLAQVNTALPLYLHNFVGGATFSHLTLSGFFTLYVLVTALVQWPVVRYFRAWQPTQTLQVSAGLWAVGFCFVWAAGRWGAASVPLTLVALTLLAVATAAYLPMGSTFVADLAPVERRGLYLAVNSLCWAVGYLIGPPLGGAVLDLPRPWADGLWLGLALSTLALIGGLRQLVGRPGGAEPVYGSQDRQL
ncbi:MAG: MFS transporter [Gloeomargaritaceae cyanobacterium C42_A2020_066]|nr:MFS transporter [Gloeomargaritaceae cyanobacterium C42_A2020_066]